MRIAQDLAVFVEHPGLLIVIAFLIVFIKEVVRALGL